MREANLTEAKERYERQKRKYEEDAKDMVGKILYERQTKKGAK